MNFLIDHFMLILTHFSIFSSIDLSNIAAAVYSTELCNRLRIFLSACPPSSPQPHVNELLIAIADFERDLELWNIRLVIEKIQNMFWFQVERVLICSHKENWRWSVINNAVRTLYQNNLQPTVDVEVEALSYFIFCLFQSSARWRRFKGIVS